MIEIRNLRKVYGDFVAVQDLTLTVQPGEILGLVGPNGAGKTTTLRCLVGILPPTAGTVRIAGHDLEKEPVPARRHLAFVPDEPRLFEHLTVADYLRFIGRLYSVPDAEERSYQLLEDFGLEERRDAFPDELSRGMKQKLMVAGALLHRPRALIFDEPLTGLDPGAIRRMKQVIVDTAETAGTAVLVSSHLLPLVEAICHRILLIQGGKKLLEGSVAEIRDALPELDANADLEEIFLHATEGKRTAADSIDATDPTGAGGAGA